MRYLAVWLALFNLVLAQEANVVNTNHGPVRGYKDPQLDLFAYYGIPYASTPKGRDRFKAPLPPPTWTEPFEAVNDLVLCLQNIPGFNVHQTEDCLVVNVFVPNTNETDLPVLVGIHGGGFQWGYSTMEMPKELVNHKKNVIAVTFNYRLGPLGFLCLGTEDIPGNAGMKDQVALLRWVKENIAHFGGNPNDVTIHGCSAGGGSVDLLMLSQMANGLFNKVIGMSGSSVSVFAVQMDPTENARNFAKRMDYDGEDNLEDLDEFFKTVSLEKLTSVSNLEHKDSGLTFAPCIERDLGKERFLDDFPTNIINSDNYIKYPVMYGYSAMEGLYRMNIFHEWKVAMNENFAQFLPVDLTFESEEQREAVASSVKKFYFNNRTVSNETVQEFVDFISDSNIIVGMHRGVSLQVKAGNNKIYLQVVSFTDINTPPIPHTDELGASHCSQSILVLDPPKHAAGVNFTAEYLEMSRTLRELWLNFITTGNPTPAGQTPASVPNWEPAGVNRSPCMYFGSTIGLIGPFEKHRQEFWDDIYDRFHRTPVAPYNFPSSSGNLKNSYLFLGLMLVLSMFTSN